MGSLWSHGVFVAFSCSGLGRPGAQKHMPHLPQHVEAGQSLGGPGAGWHLRPAPSTEYLTKDWLTTGLPCAGGLLPGLPPDH